MYKIPVLSLAHSRHLYFGFPPLPLTPADWEKYRKIQNKPRTVYKISYNLKTKRVLRDIFPASHSVQKFPGSHPSLVVIQPLLKHLQGPFIGSLNKQEQGTVGATKKDRHRSCH
jgi:hypothetical protein